MTMDEGEEGMTEDELKAIVIWSEVILKVYRDVDDEEATREEACDKIKDLCAEVRKLQKGLKSLQFELLKVNGGYFARRALEGK